jgi:hypothetical protein
MKTKLQLSHLAIHQSTTAASYIIHHVSSASTNPSCAYCCICSLNSHPFLHPAGPRSPPTHLPAHGLPLTEIPHYPISSRRSRSSNHQYTLLTSSIASSALVRDMSKRLSEYQLTQDDSSGPSRMNNDSPARATAAQLAKRQ